MASSSKWSRCEDNNNNNNNYNGGSYGDGGTARMSGMGATCQQRQCINKGNGNYDDNGGENVDDQGEGWESYPPW
jgi:hypothetical protein